jgi:hydroxymethylpyrimidine pyrophosphatase-like HAD family hydrolase
VPWATLAVCLDGALVVERSGNVFAEHTLPSDQVEDLLSQVTTQLDVGFAATFGAE